MSLYELLCESMARADNDDPEAVATRQEQYTEEEAAAAAAGEEEEESDSDDDDVYKRKHYAKEFKDTSKQRLAELFSAIGKHASVEPPPRAPRRRTTQSSRQPPPASAYLQHDASADRGMELPGAMCEVSTARSRTGRARAHNAFTEQRHWHADSQPPEPHATAAGGLDTMQHVRDPAERLELVGLESAQMLADELLDSAAPEPTVHDWCRRVRSVTLGVRELVYWRAAGAVGIVAALDPNDAFFAVLYVRVAAPLPRDVRTDRFHVLLQKYREQTLDRREHVLIAPAAAEPAHIEHFERHHAAAAVTHDYEDYRRRVAHELLAASTPDPPLGACAYTCGCALDQL